MTATYSSLFEKYEGFPKLRDNMEISSFKILKVDYNSPEHEFYQGNIHILGSAHVLVNWNATYCNNDRAKHRKEKEYGIEVWPERRHNFVRNEHNNNLIKRYIAGQIVEFDEDVPAHSELE